MTFEDLEVYKKLKILNHEVFLTSLDFPALEKYELASQLRRAANSIPANIAETFGNKHTNIYLEGISRAQGELRETRHHLNTAHQRGYIDENKIKDFISRYEECSKMLWGLERSLNTNN